MSQNLFAGTSSPSSSRTRSSAPTSTTRCRSSSGGRCPTCATVSSRSTAGSCGRCSSPACGPTVPHRKSAAAVGEVLKKYHPHGDRRVYDALVRMAQDWSLRVPAGRRPRQLRLGRRRPAGRLPLHRGAAGADGDGAPARHRQRDGRLRAELRRLRAASRSCCPRRFPNLLVNGAGGIAVGMATNIPPHNLGEVIDAIDPLPRQPRGHAARPDEVREGPGLPDGRHDHGPPGHPGRLRDRPRLDQGPRASTIEEGTQSRRSIVVTELPVPGQQGAPGREDRRPRQDRQDQGHRRRPRRVQPRRACGW